MKTTAIDATPEQTVPAFDVRYADVIDQLELDYKAKESSAKTVAVTLSVARQFFTMNKKSLGEKADPEFFNQVEITLANPDATETGIFFPEEFDSSYRSRVTAITTAYKALTGQLFVGLLNQLLERTDLTKKEIADQTGISTGTLHWLCTGNSFDTLRSEKIKKLDEILGAGGQLIAAYTAVPNHKCASNLLALLTGQKQFGTILRAARCRDGRTISHLAAAAGATAAQVGRWERNQGIPTMDGRTVVNKLDLELKCNGELVATWLAENPRERDLQADKYALKQEKWPKRLKDQFEKFIDYNTTNLLQLPRKRKFAWREASIAMTKIILKKFFGYLLKEHQMVIEDLSLLLLANWVFMAGYLNFVRQRTGRLKYNHNQKMLVEQYISWLRPYFDNLWLEAETDPYWKNNLPTSVTVATQIAPGYAMENTYPLTKTQQRWSVANAEAVKKAQDFLKSNEFENANFVKLARPFIESKISLADVVPLIIAELYRLPRKISKMRDAIQMRRIAICCVMILRAFRRGTFERMRLQHVRITNGKISWDIPLSITKNAKPIKGEMGEFEWAQEAIRRYIEVRPMLIGAGTDQGYFFVARGSGAKMSKHTFYNDTRRILSVNPQAMRYVLVTCGKRLGCSDDELADVLANTAEMIRQTYEKTDAEDHNAIAVKTVMKVFEASKSKK